MVTVAAAPDEKVRNLDPVPELVEVHAAAEKVPNLCSLAKFIGPE